MHDGLLDVTFGDYDRYRLQKYSDGSFWLSHYDDVFVPGFRTDPDVQDMVLEAAGETIAALKARVAELEAEAE